MGKSAFATSILGTLIALLAGCNTEGGNCASRGGTVVEGVCECPRGTAPSSSGDTCIDLGTAERQDSGNDDSPEPGAAEGVGFDAGTTDPRTVADEGGMEAGACLPLPCPSPGWDSERCICKVPGTGGDHADGGKPVADASGPSCIPRQETCDDRDEDCDGIVDNGVKNACGKCGAVPAETCDGRDNDCDGMVDEGVTNACGTCGAVPAEVCDGRDNDCDGMIDEGTTKNWYGDCDHDGYYAKAPKAFACSAAPSSASCQRWSEQTPAAGSIDCQDQDSSYHPGAGYGFAGAYNGDTNCDGTVEKETSAGGLQFTTSDMKLWLFPLKSRDDCPGFAVIQNGSPVFQATWPCSPSGMLVAQVDANCDIISGGMTYSAGQICR